MNQRQELYVQLGVQMLMLLIAAMVLDSGKTLRCFLISAAIFWSVVAVGETLRFRQRHQDWHAAWRLFCRVGIIPIFIVVTGLLYNVLHESEQTRMYTKSSPGRPCVSAPSDG